MNLNDWAAIKAKPHTTLVVVCGDKSFPIEKPAGCISVRGLHFTLCHLLFTHASAVYVCHDASLKDSTTIAELAEDVHYEDPTKQPLHKKIRAWSTLMKELGHDKRLIVMPANRYDECSRQCTLGDGRFFVDGGQRLIAERDEFDAVFVCRSISQELQLQVEDVGKTVWLEDGDGPRPKGLFPRPGDASINRTRVPVPAYQFDDEIKIFSVATELDVEKDAACLTELWSRTAAPNTYIAISRSHGVFPVILVRRDWSEEPQQGARRTAKLMFWYRLAEPGNWADFKNSLVMYLARQRNGQTKEEEQTPTVPTTSTQTNGDDDDALVGTATHTVNAGGTVIVNVGDHEVVGFANEDLTRGEEVSVGKDRRVARAQPPIITAQPNGLTTTTSSGLPPCT
jgi:hypothetical protein